MTKKGSLLKKFSVLTWNDLEDWAGSRITDRGRRYQQQGRVVDIAVTEDSALLGWVLGSERYATKVVMDKGGLPESICSCPYGIDCKHGVAIVIEYLKQLEKNQPVAQVQQDDDRLKLLAGECLEEYLGDDEISDPDIDFQDISTFLKRKTKAQLIELFHELSVQFPEMARELSDRKQLNSGNAKEITTRLRGEIQEIGCEPGWQNYWQNEGYTPDYSGIRKKLKTLLNAGHTEEVLTLGRELITVGCRQVEESDDEGETAREIASCMPLIVDALEQSNLDSAEKLSWALDAVLEDNYYLCEAFEEYLHEKHPKTSWNKLADQLLSRLNSSKPNKLANDFSRKFNRDQLSNWTIHALEYAGRKTEIIPLSMAEAELTESYDRLVKRLIDAKRYEDAEEWIFKGIHATKEEWRGTASGLRNKFLEIRTIQKNWPVVTAIQVEEFVRRPSSKTFSDCKKASKKIRVWPKVRGFLLHYLEKGELPWKQKGWSLPESGLDLPDTEQRKRYPMINHLIDIAISEKKPDQVLNWYDQLPKGPYGWYGIDDNAIATSIKTHAPDRAVGIWKSMAEELIARVKPSAYKEASKYLRKAAKIMNKKKQEAEWARYIKTLRETHARKRRLLEILDALEEKPIISKSR